MQFNQTPAGNHLIASILNKNDITRNKVDAVCDSIKRQSLIRTILH